MPGGSPDFGEVYRWPDGSRIVRFLNTKAYHKALDQLFTELDPPHADPPRQFIWPVATIDIQDQYLLLDENPLFWNPERACVPLGEL